MGTIYGNHLTDNEDRLGVSRDKDESIVTRMAMFNLNQAAGAPLSPPKSTPPRGLLRKPNPS